MKLDETLKFCIQYLTFIRNDLRKEGRKKGGAREASAATEISEHLSVLRSHRVNLERIKKDIKP